MQRACDFRPWCPGLFLSALVPTTAHPSLAKLTAIKVEGVRQRHRHEDLSACCWTSCCKQCVRGRMVRAAAAVANRPGWEGRWRYTATQAVCSSHRIIHTHTYTHTQYTQRPAAPLFSSSGLTSRQKKRRRRRRPLGHSPSLVVPALPASLTVASTVSFPQRHWRQPRSRSFRL